MHITIKFWIATVFFCLPSCYSLSRVQPFTKLSDTLNERAFVNWMKSDPMTEAKARMSDGNFEYLGLAIYSEDKYWIPGIALEKKVYKRSDVIWKGISERYEKHIPLAETYMTQFNTYISNGRHFVKINSYGKTLIYKTSR